MVKLRAVRSDEVADKPGGVRRSVYVFGAVVLGIALVALLLTSVLGGDGGSEPPVAAPSSDPAQGGGDLVEPVARRELRPGGRDPFRALVSASSGAPAPAAPTPAPAAPEPTAEPSTLVEVLAVENGAANIRVGANLHEGVKPGAQLSDGFVLEAIEGECAFLAKSPERFRVCAGERYLK